MARTVRTAARAALLLPLLLAVAAWGYEEDVGYVPPPGLTMVDIGLVTHFLGNGTNPGASAGAGPNALLENPNGCAVGANGIFYLCDTLNRVVRRVRAGSSEAEIFLGALDVIGDRPQTGTAARLSAPWAIRIMPDEVRAYLLDFSNHKIYSVALTSAVMQNWAGTGLPGDADGVGGGAQLNGPADLVISRVTLDMYVVESLGHRIRKATQTAVISHFAGSATGLFGLVNANGRNARFNRPQGIDMVQTSGKMFISDSANRVIRTLTLEGDTATVAGSGVAGNFDGKGLEVEFGSPFALALDTQAKYLFIADRGNNLVRRMDTTTYFVVTVVGDLNADWASSVASVTAQVAAPSGLCFNRATNYLYIAGDHSVSFVHKSKTMTMSSTVRHEKSLTLQSRPPTPPPSTGPAGVITDVPRASAAGPAAALAACALAAVATLTLF